MEVGPVSSQILILLYGRDTRLLESRQLVLQRAGYEVWIALGLAEIDAISQVEVVDLLILCHTLTVEECGRALFFSQSRWPLMKSLVLSALGSWCEGGEPDQVFDSVQGPAKLVAILSHLFSEERRLHSHLY
jgi:hypothetical protein